MRRPGTDRSRRGPAECPGWDGEQFRLRCAPTTSGSAIRVSPTSGGSAQLEDLKQIADAIAAGELTVPIAVTFPIEQIRDFPDASECLVSLLRTGSSRWAASRTPFAAIRTWKRSRASSMESPRWE